MRVRGPLSLAGIAARLQAGPLALVAAAGGPPVMQVLQGLQPALVAAAQHAAPNVPLLVGPEGDFTGVPSLASHSVTGQA